VGVGVGAGVQGWRRLRAGEVWLKRFRRWGCGVVMAFWFGYAGFGLGVQVWGLGLGGRGVGLVGLLGFELWGLV
jgi:hypothetical protein